MILAALLLAVHPVEPETAVEAERAFAQDAQEIGQWAAFEKWAQDDAYLVGQRMIPARQFARDASQSEPLYAIHWWPTQSFSSCDGKTVFNVGAFYSPMDGTFGKFHTLWEHTEIGWRYKFDMGFETDIPLPVPVTVEQVVPDCESRPVQKTMLIIYPGEHDVGNSADNTMKWGWIIADGKREVGVSIWNGEDYEDVYLMEEAIP